MKRGLKVGLAGASFAAAQRIGGAVVNEISHEISAEPTESESEPDIETSLAQFSGGRVGSVRSKRASSGGDRDDELPKRLKSDGDLLDSGFLQMESATERHELADAPVGEDEPPRRRASTRINPNVSLRNHLAALERNRITQSNRPARQSIQSRGITATVSSLIPNRAQDIAQYPEPAQGIPEPVVTRSGRVTQAEGFGRSSRGAR